MTKYVFILFIGLELLYSCKNNDDNIQQPSVQIILPEENSDIILNSLYKFQAHFQDNTSSGLSSYIIRIWNPEIGENRIIDDPDKTETDSLVYVDQVFQRANIFGVQDTTIQHSFSVDTVATYKGKSYPIVKGKYLFQVTVMNMYGNKDTASVNINLIK